MTAFNLKFDTGNAAFDEGNGPAEAARILRKIATALENGHDCGGIMDANGNTVGAWDAEFPEAEEDEPDADYMGDNFEGEE